MIQPPYCLVQSGTDMAFELSSRTGQTSIVGANIGNEVPGYAWASQDADTILRPLISAHVLSFTMPCFL